jgi:hypothetical protein
MGATIMGRVIPFRRANPDLQALTLQLERLHFQILDSALDLRTAQTHLCMAEEKGDRRLQLLDEYLAILRWTTAF